MMADERNAPQSTEPAKQVAESKLDDSTITPEAK